MPNWCDNSVTLSHPDKSKVDALAASLEKEDKEFLNHLRPNPAGEWDYGWSCSNWGTKWDASDVVVTDESANQITVIFDTAWTPPTGFYDKMVDLGFDVDAKYYESGCGFCGRYDESGDTCYEWEDLESARKTIPKDIDEEFNIIEMMEEWDEDE